MIKYLGSKRTLLPAILDAVAALPNICTVLDLFSGTSRVGHALKAAGYRVIANDHNAYAHTLATCYIQSDAAAHARPAQLLIDELNQLARSITTAPPDALPARIGPLLAPEGPTLVATGEAQRSGAQPVVHDVLGAPAPEGRTNGRRHAPDNPPPAIPSSHAPADLFTTTYCIQSRFFHPANGPRIFAIRNAIARKSLPPELESILLTSLLEAADRVDSTTGVQMAYLKSWAPRALRPLELRLPRLLPGRGQALNLDALDTARLHGPAADAIYLDPPYNQHSYLGNYHIWESLIRWDFPEVYGLARKRTDVRTRRSPFNSRRGCLPALARLLDALPPDKPLILSFSNEGFITRAEMESLLAPRGQLRTLEHDYKRYVGAQIGIYNPRGQKVGRISHLRNKELLFIVAP